MVRTVGQRQAELAFQLSILFDPQAALKVNVNPWMFIILLDGAKMFFLDALASLRPIIKIKWVIN